ncbi:MAG: hypothetical protein LH473_11905 [Chitinophagales bacterium]|nr:hypothetical protein [Chitinophagales bacterium]
MYLIICVSSQNYHFKIDSFSNDAWVVKLDLNGATVTGWTSQWNTHDPTNPNNVITIYPVGKFYGSRQGVFANPTDIGEDIAKNIKVDHDGNYVVVGQAWKSGDDVPSGTQYPHDGDIWVFKLDPSSGNILTGKNAVYVQSGVHRGNDYATSVVVDCNSPYDYVISSFCKSCDPNPLWYTGLGPWQQMWLLKIPSDFSSYSDEQYGWNANDFDKWDYGSFNITQLFEGTFGTCTSGDGFLSLGVQHPTSLVGCFGSNHDFLAVKTNNSLVNYSNFNTPCTNAKRKSTNTNAGVAHGGRYGDTGLSAVQTCNGYILAGFSTSNYKDDPNQKTFCDNLPYDCDVSCNHYDCDADPQTSDIWIVMVDGTDGSYLWD